MNKVKLQAISRIYKDLKEVEDHPIDGISICIPNEDQPFFLICNVMILSGIYEGILLHLEMWVPENYPVQAPTLRLSPGQAFDERFHHHIHGERICIDLLNNGFFDGDSGWSPAYTFLTILMQMQVFFAEDHDLFSLPSKEQIKNLKDQNQKFICQIKVTDGSFINHSFENPYPPFKSENKSIRMEAEKKQRIMQKMTCFVTRATIEDDRTIIGYPLLVMSKNIYGLSNTTKENEYKLDNSFSDFSKMQVFPIFDPLSQYGFELMEKEEKFSVVGTHFNYWLPLYINEENYRKIRPILYDSINLIAGLKLGILDYDESDVMFDLKPIAHEYDFEFILKFFPRLLSQTIYSIKDVSETSINGYCQILRLFLRILQDCPDLISRINEKVQGMIENEEMRHMDELGDIGELILLLSFSKNGLRDQEVMWVIFKEFLIRQTIEDFPMSYYSMNNKKLVFYQGMTGKGLKEFYDDKIHSNNVFLFNFTMARLFFSKKDEFIKTMDSNFGWLDESQLHEFMEEVNKIKKVNSYEEFLIFIGLQEKIQGTQELLNLFRETHKYSYIKGYNMVWTSQLNENIFRCIREILILIQWFITDHRDVFEYLFNHKKIVRALQSLLAKNPIADISNLFNEDENIQDFFLDNSRQMKFYMDNLLSQNFFHDFLIMIDSARFKKHPKILLSNKQNSKIYSESNLEILNGNSIAWSMVFSFELLSEALPNDSQGKIGNLQAFCFFYKMLLRCFKEDKVFYRNMMNEEKIFDCGPLTNFCQSRDNYLLCMIIKDYITKKFNESKVNSFQKSIDFVKECSKWDKNMSKMAGKMMILVKTMSELDKMDFKTEMEEDFFILKRDTCLKIIHCLRIFNEKELNVDMRC